MTSEFNSKMRDMLLEEALTKGNFEGVRKITQEVGMDPQISLELIAQTQIHRLSSGRFNSSYEAIAVWNSPEIREYFNIEQADAGVAIESSVLPGSQEDALFKLVETMIKAIGSHIDMKYFAGISPRRMAAIDLFLSTEIDCAIEKFDSRKLSLILGPLTGTTYSHLLVSGAVEIISMDDFVEYSNKMEKRRKFLSIGRSFFREEMGFQSTMHYLNTADIHTCEGFDKIRQVLDLAIELNTSIMGKERTEIEVASWLSNVPDDYDKSYIRNQLLSSHDLDSSKVDEHTTPTDVFLTQRVESALFSYFENYGKGKLNLTDCVSTDEHRVLVADAIVKNLEKREYRTFYAIERVHRLVQQDRTVYDAQIVSEGFKNEVWRTFNSFELYGIRTIDRLRALAPLVELLYKGKEKMPDFQPLLSAGV